METCVVCSKKLNIFNIRKGLQLKSGEHICLSCANKLDKNTIRNFKNLEKEDLPITNCCSQKIGYEGGEKPKRCCICQEPLTIINSGIGNRIKTGERICLQCLKRLDYNTFDNLKQMTKDQVLKSYYSHVQDRVRFSQSDTPKKNVVIEYKRTCNQCGKVWHVLAEREKYLEKEKRFNNCNMCATAIGTADGNVGSWMAWTQTKRNEHALENETTRLKQCPNCMSSDYTETKIEYEK